MTMSDLDTRYLTVQEVAAHLRLEESTVYKMCRQKQIPSVRFGKKAVRIPRLAFERYLQFVYEEADLPQRPVPTTPPSIDLQIEEFTEYTGCSPEEWVRRWREGGIPDTQENSQVAVIAHALRDAQARSQQDTSEHEPILALAALTSTRWR
jgi:excisionase family DNA binding protein